MLVPSCAHYVWKLSLPQLVGWDPVVVATAVPEIVWLTVLFAIGQLLLAVNLLLAILFPFYAIYNGALAANIRLRGFASTSLSHVYVGAKTYQKGNTQLLLMGMIHFGSSDCYGKLLTAIPAGRTVVLNEGLADTTGRLSRGIRYDKVAATLGLQTQIGSFIPADRKVDERRADLDVADFDERTVQLIDLVGSCYAGDGLNFAQLRRFIELVTTGEHFAVAYGDVVDSRNACLLRHLDEVVGTYDRIVIPWGVGHLPDIERAVVARGFELVKEEQFPVISYAEVWAALRGR